MRFPARSLAIACLLAGFAIVNALPVAAQKLGFSKAFSPDTVAPGEISRLTYTIYNPSNVIEVGSVAFSDKFAYGLNPARRANVSRAGCGTSSRVSTESWGSSQEAYVELRGGIIAPGGTCTISVDVRASRAGTFLDKAGVTSDLPVGTTVSATLTVIEDPVKPLGFYTAFSPDTVEPGEISRLTYTIHNPFNVIEVGSVAFGHTFAYGVTVATPTNLSLGGCGNARFATSNRSGRGEVFLSGGTVAASGTCTISLDVRPALFGTFPEVSGRLTSDLPVATPGASATLTVRDEVVILPLGFTMAYSPDAVEPGEISRLTYTIDNSANVIEAGLLGFTQYFLSGGVTVATPTNLSLGGCGNARFEESKYRIRLLRGTVAAGGTCVISLNVQALRTGTFRTVTSPLSSDLLPSARPRASATLTVSEAPINVPLGFSKAFSPDTVGSGESWMSRLTFTIDNTASLIDVGGLAFTDGFPDGLAVAQTPNAANNCGGFFSARAGTRDVDFTGGRVAAGQSCELSVDVVASRVGALTDRSGDLTSDLPGDVPGVEATLTVEPTAALGFSKAFPPATVFLGGTSRLTYTIDNTANLIGVGSLAFSDALPDGLAVAGTPNAATTCGGTFAPAASATSLAFTGGRVAAGQSCELAVNVVASRAGALTDTSGPLTSDLPAATPRASATLTVSEALMPLGFSKAFSPDTVFAGESWMSRLTYTIDNTGNPINVGSLAFTDALPDGLAVAGTPNAATTCGGTFAPAASATSLAFTGGRVRARSRCRLAVNVVASRAGTPTSMSGELTSDLPAATPGALAILTVNEESMPLGFTMAYSPGAVEPGEISRLTYTIDNSANVIEAGSLGFVHYLPSGGVTVATPTHLSLGGCGNARFGESKYTSGRLSLSRGTVAAGGTCVISLNVQALRTGTFRTVTSPLSSDLLPSARPRASATLTVSEAPINVPLGFSKAFSPDTVDLGGISRLTFTIDNTASLIDVGGLAFDDDFPDGLAVAQTPNASTTCGGTFTPAASETSLDFTGGRVAAGQSCELSVDVVASRVGALTGTSRDLTSDDGHVATPGVEATLTVEPAAAPGFSKAFSPATVFLGGTSRLTYTIDNTANLIGVGSLDFTDALPDGLAVAARDNAETTCGVGFPFSSRATGATSLAFAGGRVRARRSCTIAINVVASRAGTLTSMSGELTSDLPAATPGASAILTVTNEAPMPLGFSKAFSPATVDLGEISRLTYTIDNSANVNEVGSLAFEDYFPRNLVVARTPDASTTCGGTFTPAVSASNIRFSGGSVAAGGTCVISLNVQPRATGTQVNTSGELTSNLPGDALRASATLTVSEASVNGPLRFSQAFSPDTVGSGESWRSRLTFTIDNTASLIDVGGLAFINEFSRYLVVAPTLNAANNCGGYFSARAGQRYVSYTHGRVAAGQSCTISVDVRAERAGVKLLSESRPLTSDLPAATPGAVATLTAEALKAFHAADAAGLFPGYGLCGRGVQADLHDRQYGEPV